MSSSKSGSAGAAITSKVYQGARKSSRARRIEIGLSKPLKHPRRAADACVMLRPELKFDLRLLFKHRIAPFFAWYVLPATVVVGIVAAAVNVTS